MSKLFIPPIVVPAILLIGILAYGLLRAPTPPLEPIPIALKSGAPASQ